MLDPETYNTKVLTLNPFLHLRIVTLYIFLFENGWKTIKFTFLTHEIAQMANIGLSDT